MFVNRLVCTPEDVDLFVKQGIVESKLGDSFEVCTLANKLADGVIMNPHYFYISQLFVKNSMPATAPLGTLGRQN